MTFCEELIANDMEFWLDFADLPFLSDMIQNRLDHRKFSHYLIQDTQYLAAFAKIYAWSFIKTDDLQLMQELYGEMGIIVAGETQSHRNYLSESGFDEKDIMNRKASDTNSAYMDCMIRAARDGSLAEGIFAVGPCNFSYYYLGLEIKRRMEAAGTYETNYFRDWLDYYISEEYKEGCDRYQAICDRVSNHLSVQEQERIRQLFRKCSKYERDFWIMAYEEPGC